MTHNETSVLVAVTIAGSRSDALLRTRGISQEDLSDLSGVSARTVQRWTKGKAVGLVTAKALAIALRVTMDDLYIFKERRRRFRLTNS